MLNKEKYAKELVEIACDPERVALDKQNNRICACNQISCINCRFYVKEGSDCRSERIKWANSEYIEMNKVQKKLYKIPSLDDIESLYNEIVPMLTELNTKNDVIKFAKKHHVTMEINYDIADRFDENESIEVIRCENWGDLDYIYVYKDARKPIFDVWCDFLEFDFITDIHMEDLRKEYDAGIQLIWCKTPEDKLPELVNILKCVGITMRGYRTKEYMDKLVGNVFRSKSDDLKAFSGLKVKKIIRELTEKDYDRELVDKTDKDESGNCRYEINCMYEIELENGEIINVYEDEINPEYHGDYEK